MSKLSRWDSLELDLMKSSFEELCYFRRLIMGIRKGRDIIVDQLLITNMVFRLTFVHYA